MFRGFQKKALKAGLALTVGAAAFTLSVGINPPEIAGKQSTVASLPTVSISAGEQAHAYDASNWRYQYLGTDAGFSSNSWTDMVNAANRNNAAKGVGRRYGIQRAWSWRAWSYVVVGFTANF